MAFDGTLTSRDKDFSAWYLDVIAAADLAEHSPVKGSMIIKPYGFALWEQIRDTLDTQIKATGHQNAYFPLLIPESFLKREKEHVEGFSPELAVVTHAGGEKLDEPLVVRPTSETIIYDAFSRWIQSYRDLPLLINQWANVVRWELRPRLFLRTTEFLWQEGHTAHQDEMDAEAEARRMLEVYQSLAQDTLAMPVIAGEKTASERFAGAKRTYTIEAMMQDGKALQAGTSHNLGQGFSEAFNVQFTDKDGGRKFVWLTSWGVSTRLIGGIIMTHSDDAGLLLPPAVAPIQVVVIPIFKTASEEQAVLEAADALKALLDYRVHVDARAHYSPGYKFNEWEKKGVPVRVEIGPRDVAHQSLVIVRRDTGEKETVAVEEAATVIAQRMDDIQKNLAHRAHAFREEHTEIVTSDEELAVAVAQGFARAYWCGDTACEEAIKAETTATIRCLPFNQVLTGTGSCVHCGKTSQTEALFARAY